MSVRTGRIGTGSAGSTISFGRGLWPMVAFLVVTTLLATLFPLYVYPNLGTPGTLAAMGAAFAAVVLLAWLALRYEGVTAADVGLGRANVVPGVLVVVVCYLLVNAVAAVLAFRETGAVRFAVPGDLSVTAWAVMAFLQLFLVGIAEELGFRGYVQNKLVAVLGGGDDRLRKAGAILLGVVLFTAWHVPQRVVGQGLTAPADVLGTLVVVGILGTLLGVLYEYTRNVVLGGFLHGTFNWSFVFVADAPGETAFLVVLPVFVGLVWYYRRWASARDLPGFGSQCQTRPVVG